jgi:hypothetical protein
LVRLALLDRFGGVWCDVGILLFESLDPLWSRLRAAPDPAAHALPASREEVDGHGHAESSPEAAATGGLAHFYLGEWGAPEYDRKDFVEVRPKSRPF